MIRCIGGYWDILWRSNGTMNIDVNFGIAPDGLINLEEAVSIACATKILRKDSYRVNFLLGSEKPFRTTGRPGKSANVGEDDLAFMRAIEAAQTVVLAANMPPEPRYDYD